MAEKELTEKEREEKRKEANRLSSKKYRLKNKKQEGQKSMKRSGMTYITKYASYADIEEFEKRMQARKKELENKEVQNQNQRRDQK